MVIYLLRWESTNGGEMPKLSRGLRQRSGVIAFVSITAPWEYRGLTGRVQSRSYLIDGVRMIRSVFRYPPEAGRFYIDPLNAGLQFFSVETLDLRDNRLQRSRCCVRPAPGRIYTR